MAKDAPIEQTWRLLEAMLYEGHRVIFITGRPETQREVTYNWLMTQYCPVRVYAWHYWQKQTSYQGKAVGPIIYMRKSGDRRASHIVKGELLEQARMDGFDPKLAFEDRKDDTAMWRAKGLLCCQVAEGNY